MSEMQQAAVAARKSKMSVRDICYAGLFAAVIAVMAQISIPMPMGVPMTMQTFAITLAAVVLGSKLSTISSLISGGFDKFVGPTGGFLLSFPLMAFIIGWGAEHRKDFKGAYVIALVVGTVVNYVVGVALFCAVAKASVATGITACVLPFIPTAIIKAILASVIGFAIRERVPELKK
jgi:biotin transport system substrate-specific component